MTVAYIGYVECDNCDQYVYIKDARDLKIWFHPDDPKPLSEIECTNCHTLVQSRISWEHMVNFRRRGCKVTDLNERFTPLTEEEIENWDFDADYEKYFKNL